jgi:hypothetical protein
MNLLERLQQGQTLLSAGSFPNDAPINDPQSGFIQSNLPNSTYEDETIGQPNNGSTLINTLDNTALDITNFNQSNNIDSPTDDWVTNYPPLVSGEFNGAPSLYELAYSVNNTYLANVPIQTENSPQIPTLSSSSLDNTGSNAVTTIIPNSTSYPNNYPEIEGVNLGALNGTPSDYQSSYNTDNTYLQNVSDNVNSINTNILGQTGLDNTNFSYAQTTVTPNSTFYPNIYPSLVSGEFNGTPSQYVTPYNLNSTYLDNIPIETPNSPQVNTLSQTGLDNTNSNAEQTATMPNNISAPNDYPELVSGKFGGSPSPYGTLYNADNTYLSNIPVQDPNSTQINTLFSTGLDNTNTNSDPTTVVPDSISYPNNYPALTSGEFNGASSQYTSPYNSENPYLNSIPIQDPNSPQIPTLGETGLDLEDATYAPTAIVPNSTSYPNNYPALSGVNLAGIGAPKQYSTNWRQNNNYLNNFGSSLHSSLFGISNLDNASSTTSPPLISNQINPQDAFNIIFASSLTGAGTSVASNTPPPVTSTSPTNYPALEHVYLGEFNGAPSQYNTIYNASSTYLQKYNIIVNQITNPQTNTLDETGLDVENSDALSTSLLFAPTNPDNITTYPVIAGINLGVTGSGAQGFNQVYKPSNTYWNNYLTNRSLFDALTV